MFLLRDFKGGGNDEEELLATIRAMFAMEVGIPVDYKPYAKRDLLLDEVIAIHLCQ